MSRATLWILGGIFAVVLSICVVGAVLILATQDSEVDVNLGDDEFEIEEITARADLVAEDGALRFADPTGGNRPIIVNHVGDDPETGWVAVLACPPAPRAASWTGTTTTASSGTARARPTRPTAKASTSSPPGSRTTPSTSTSAAAATTSRPPNPTTPSPSPASELFSCIRTAGTMGASWPGWTRSTSACRKPGRTETRGNDAAGSRRVSSVAPSTCSVPRAHARWSTRRARGKR